VRGIPVTPRDVDFAAADGERVANAFSDVLVEPPIFDPDWVADWFGRTWMGAIVEWAADVHPEIDDWRTPQESGPEAQAALEEVEWRGRVIRVTPLAKQLAVSESRGLHDRVEAIHRFERGRTG
jgi:hypothetical protein